MISRITIRIAAKGVINLCEAEFYNSVKIILSSKEPSFLVDFIQNICLFRVTFSENEDVSVLSSQILKYFK